MRRAKQAILKPNLHLRNLFAILSGTVYSGVYSLSTLLPTPDVAREVSPRKVFEFDDRATPPPLFGKRQW
jgi:hypothetical protein